MSFKTWETREGEWGKEPLFHRREWMKKALHGVYGGATVALIGSTLREKLQPLFKKELDAKPEIPVDSRWDILTRLAAVCQSVPNSLGLLTLLRRQVDEILELPMGAKLRLIGLSHTKRNMRRKKNFFRGVMANVDLVCVESGFNSIRQMATDAGKQCVDVDGALYSGAVLSFVTGLCALFYDVENARKHRELQDPLTVRNWIRRAFLSVLYGTQIMRAGTWPMVDTSFVSDARTVRMLENILVAVDGFKSKNAVLFTGNVHAMGVSYYIKHPGVFSFKKSLYERTYWKLPGSGHRKEDLYVANNEFSKIPSKS